MRSSIAGFGTIVVKIGSSLVTDNGQGVNRKALSDWSKQIAQLTRLNKQIVLVSSGAVAEGMKRLNWSQRPKMRHELQAAAAIGQMGLMHAYEECFEQHGLKTAQILMTHNDLSDRTRYLNAQTTIRTLLDYGVVPIINENDTVSTSEVNLGDNDTLGALVANLIDADLLVILTDQDGLFTADPRKDPNATLIQMANASDPSLDKMAGGVGTQYGRGGMATKVMAAHRAARSGAHTIIAAGREPDVLLRLHDGENLGTFIAADLPRMCARKNWIADQLQLAGQFVLDEGAVRALSFGGKSLLPVGVTAVLGEFKRGEMVSCVSSQGIEIARGLTNYASSEAQQIVRKASRDIEAALGYVREPELIHRDNLVLLAS